MIWVNDASFDYAFNDPTVRARAVCASWCQRMGQNLMDDDKEGLEAGFVFRGLLALMAFAGLMILAVVLIGHGVIDG